MISLLSLLDDIAATLDDVAVMTKVALKKTTTIMSDDLAVNAGVIDGVNADRELPIVWKIFLGSLVNKIICIVGALAILAIYPRLLDLVLVVGGLYLAYEGAHKLVEKWGQRGAQQRRSQAPEATKIRGAVRTDLILSIEIIVIANSSLSGPLASRILALALVGAAASVIIYGLVALIVKTDDLGLILLRRGHRRIGLLLINSMPYTMRALGIIGTAAMFLVGGGIIAHALHLPHLIHESLQNLGVGVIVGVILVGVHKGLSWTVAKRTTN